MTGRTIFGLSAALITPFRTDGGIDGAALAHHARSVLADGCDTVTLFGTTGEGFSIGLAERAEGLSAVLAGGVGAGRVYATVTASVVVDAVAQARMALDAGVRGLLFTPPFYLKGLDDDGLYAWFAAAFEAIGDPRGVVLYHVPGQTAVPLSPALIARIRRAFPGVVTAIKDSSGDFATTEAFLAAHGDIAVLVGDERLLARAMALGAQGSICGLGNTAPAVLRRVIHDGVDDPRVARLVALVLAEPVLPAVKALVAHRHGEPGYARTRPPLVDLDPARAKTLCENFAATLAAEPAL